MEFLLIGISWKAFGVMPSVSWHRYLVILVSHTLQLSQQQYSISFQVLRSYWPSYVGFIGMEMSYGLSLNMSLVLLTQNQCMLENYIISVERVNQYMHLPREAPIVIKENRPPANWPNVGKVDIQDLHIRYRPDAPLVLGGVTCTFEGGHKIGIVGRTGAEGDAARSRSRWHD